MDEKNEINKILKLFYNGQTTIIDDNDDKEKEIYGLVQFRTDGDIAALLYVYSQCLNKVYIGKDGKLHLSKCNIGGTIYEMDVEKYNYSIDGDKISIIYFKEGIEIL